MSIEAIEKIEKSVRDMLRFAEDIRSATDGCAPDVAENTSVGVRGFALRIEAEASVLFAENEKLREALRAAIPWACLKCTFWDSRRARCSRGSGMCDQVWKWKQLLGEVRNECNH